MIGISLSPEQIQSAPPEVRRWIEQLVAGSFGLLAPEPQPLQVPPHLVACEPAEIRSIFTRIHGLLPVTAVFLELGREGGSSSSRPDLRAFRIADIMSNTLLHMPAQVVQSLEVIDAAMRDVREDPMATLFALDETGHCFVAEKTAASIRQVWREILATRTSGTPGAVTGDADSRMKEAPMGQPVSYNLHWDNRPSATAAGTPLQHQ